MTVALLPLLLLALTVAASPAMSVAAAGAPVAQSPWKVAIVDQGDLLHSEISVAVDQGGEAHVSYGANGGESGSMLMYAGRSRGVWTTQVVETAGSLLGMESSIAVGPDGNPLIAFSNGNNDLMVARRGGQSWRDGYSDGSNLFINAFGGEPSLTVDSAGYAHASAYSWRDDPEFGMIPGLRYAYQDAGGWHEESVVRNAAVGREGCIAVGPDGYPRIAYFDYSDPYEDVLMLATRQGGQWSTEEIPYQGSRPDRGVSLAIDSLGSPHVALIVDGQVCYVHKVAGQWQTEQVDTGQHVSLTLDSNDLPHLAFIGWGDDMLKHACRVDSSWQIEAVCMAASNSLTAIAASPSNLAVAFFTDDGLAVADRPWQAGSQSLGSTIFLDLGGYGWAQAAIDSLAEQEILMGMGEARFDPGGVLTRAQVATLLKRVFDLPYPEQDASYTDVTTNHWAYSYVQAASPYLPPVAQGTFGADLPCDRENAAAALVRVLADKSLLEVVTSAEADSILAGVPDAAQIDPELRELIATSMQSGIITGMPDGSFDPTGTLTRAQAAVLLDRVQTKFLQ